MFCHLENCFFLKCFFTIDLLGPKEVMLSFAQYLPQNLNYPYKLLPEDFHTR